MDLINCPFCQAKLSIPTEANGKRLKCSNCGNIFPGPPLQSKPPIELPQIQINTKTSGTKSRKARSKAISGQLSQDRILLNVIFAFAAAIASVPVAVLLSQYYPLFGGFLNGIASPWSPARRSAIPVHIVAFAIIGFIFGPVIGEIARKSKPAAGACIIGMIALFIVAFLMCLLFVRSSDFRR
jgi:hypothetical protein